MRRTRVHLGRFGWAVALAPGLVLSSACGDSTSAGDAGGAADATSENPAIVVDAAGQGDAAGGDASIRDGVAAEADADGPACDSGTDIVCNGVCVSPSDVHHCGTCANVCSGPEAGPGHAVCEPGGQCAVACDSDAGDAGATEILCSGACVSPDDIAHCGTCTKTCSAPPSGNGSAVCPAAACGVSCNPGFHGAGAACNTDCLPNTGDPSGDPCVVADGLGTFVAPTGSDTTGDGTKEKPFGTIGHAMAATLTARVYACGTFTAEQLVVGPSADGVKVFGGFDCATWAYSASTKTSLAPAARGYALQINGLVSGVTFEDFSFASVAAAPNPPASGPGASSTAVIVNASAGVVFRRSAFSAGAGQPGATGATGTNPWSGSAATGNAGSGTTGGLGQSCACGGSEGQGGEPGTFDSNTLVFAPGTDGSDGAPLGVVNHGTALNALGVGNHCTPGNPAGSTGSGGAAGVGATGVGTIAFPAGFSNAAVGGAGGNAGFAQAGGGGGGYYYIVGNTPNGAGGGGGCGGCGGVGAVSGGTSGGSSIALIVLTSLITLDTCTLTAASGGTGGQGGNGLGGQPGGGGGAGSGNNACSGGPGGTGGTGGAGGGGVGGHSIAIAYSGTAPTEVGAVTKTPASTPASGGSPGGGVSNAGSQGQSGLAVPEQSF